MKRQILTDVLTCNPHDTLYHYTTQTGLLGIVKNKEIWITHTQYLNDQREYLHALEIAKEEINEFINTTTDPQHKVLLNDMKTDLNNTENINVCVCSFSSDRDLLSLWRAYSDATSGFAIGFSGDFLAKIAAEHDLYLV